MLTKKYRQWGVLLGCIAGFLPAANAQRTYRQQSVLATGAWYRFSVAAHGVYKIDLPFLARLGVTQNNIPSAAVRIFGNGGAMLPEDNATGRPDDLLEIAIQVVDGGDGVLNGADYLLLYAQGPHRWLPDSVNQTYHHQKNLYSRESYYYLNIGGTGKRISRQPAGLQANTTINTYDFCVFHENDTLNFLKSGKQWYGEEYSNTPGNTLSRAFAIGVTGIDVSRPVTLITNVVSRSIGAASRFGFSLNGQPAGEALLPAVTGNFLQPFASSQTSAFTVMPPAPGGLQLNIGYVPGAFNAQGWLNWWQVLGVAALRWNAAGAMVFSHWQSVGMGNVAFAIDNAPAGLQVWEVTRPDEAIEMAGMLAGNVFRFVNNANRLRTYVAFDPGALPAPTPLGPVANQNLHGLGAVDLVMISHPSLLGQAQKLADHRRQASQLNTVVVTTQQVYNEFAGGTPDPTAIRDFVKMLYDRAGADTAKRPKYLLLLGDASFDYLDRIGGNTNLVPSYQSTNSLDPLQTYTSDDFFGFLDDDDDINSTNPLPLLDIAIGRIPASTPAQAEMMVNKIIAYHRPPALGSWRNQITFVADDEDGNLHLNDAETMAQTATTADTIINPQKIYLDAYRQQSNSAGSRYPAVNRAIVNTLNQGTLVWNYSGHGGSQRLAEEAVFGREEVRQLNNAGKLPLVVTATCDFAPYDDPTVRSIGDDLLLNDSTGAIALTTTTRLVFASSNRIINNNFIGALLQGGGPITLGQALLLAKNQTYRTADPINNRKFTLLGDPSLTLAVPPLRVSVDSVNGHLALGADTLQALGKYTVAGRVTDAGGNWLPGFNGTATVVVMGAARPQQTLANDPGSAVASFLQQGSPLYRGRVSVANGRFTAGFVVPKDIDYQPGRGKISLYADDGHTDARGAFYNFWVGGTAAQAVADREGPSISLFLNDEKFSDGGLVNETPVLLVHLADSSGINTSATGIGHDITAVLDDDDKNLLVLNEYYLADTDSYQRGKVRFQLPRLASGPHTLTVKAWDVANNPSEKTLHFVVENSETLQLQQVFNYPNPFTARTTFWFHHNQPASNLQVLIQIYSLTGKLVHQIQRIINTAGNRSNEIEWDGRDAYSEKLGRGVYVYKILVTAPNGKTAQRIEKLYLL